uniref:Secreted protein n=1 Tax=Heterorhabditis bacteriophora TaxID=37862 RepID=A0A1I7W646_HETBA
MFLSIVPIVLSLQGLLGLHVTHVSDCGKTRGCWLLPSGCKDASDCSILLTWKHMGRGNDTVFECHFFKKASGSVHLSHNTQKNNRVLKEVTYLTSNEFIWILDFTLKKIFRQKIVIPIEINRTVRNPGQHIYIYIYMHINCKFRVEIL